jgi:hypothetical protein
LKPASNETYVLPPWLRGWEQFWFTPADPTVLGLIRIACGMVVFYTLCVYSLSLQDFMGENGWYALDVRREFADRRPVSTGALYWNEAGRLPEPKDDFQERYLKHYRETWGFKPPPPYPVDLEQANELNQFRMEHGVDLRLNGARPWKNDFEKEYAEWYTKKYKFPPPAYPASEEEKWDIEEQMQATGVDPRRVYAWGSPIFSLWFDITDPTAMAWVHALIVFIAFLFTIGFCTRITSALVWFGSLTYIHRNVSILFGVDTMMNILLLYLMIGPSGAAFSVDRLIQRWWRNAKAGYVQAWYRFWKQPIPAASEIAAPTPVAEEPAPSISANVAIRLLQCHVCIIYLMAGLAKLQGNAWWTGSAIWGTLGNYQFAPMQYDAYLAFLAFLGRHQLLYDIFMTGGGLFTLAFEIGYAFLIWRPRLRWVILGAAFLLHGGIGLFMGLKTFSLMMLVMNMAFVNKDEALWVLRKSGLISSNGENATSAETEQPMPVPAAAGIPPTATTIKQK